MQIMVQEAVQGWLEKVNMDHVFGRYFLLLLTIIMLLLLLSHWNVPSVVKAFFVAIVLSLGIFLGFVDPWVAVALAAGSLIVLIIIVSNKIYL